MHRYEIILYWSNDDQVFIAEAPELPGCMAHGDDYETALENIQGAMKFWIDTARELGRLVPEPKGERLMLACRQGTPRYDLLVGEGAWSPAKMS